MAAVIQASGQTAREYDVKAVFLFNFATFVHWPESAFALPESPFSIGVLGDDRFGAILDRVVADERVGDRPMTVKRLEQIGDALDCQIVFISRSEAGRLGELLAAINGHPVLTVADMPGFAEAGGMIGFTPRGSRIGVTINATAVDKSQLAVSSKLLQLARVIDPPSS